MEEPRARTARRPLTIATVVVLLALLALGIWNAVEWRQATARVDDGAAAVAAAEAEVTALTSVSAQTRDADIEKLLAGATAGFRDEFEKQTDAFRKALASAKVTSTGRAVSAGLVDLDGDRARVLVAATGTVANDRTTRPEPRNYRLAVDMQKKADRWLVSGLEFVG
jgi:Mce-associated membrane protein